MVNQHEADIKEAFKYILKGSASEPVVTLDGVSILVDIKSESNVQVRFLCDNITSIHCQIDWPELARQWKDTINTENMKGN